MAQTALLGLLALCIASVAAQGSGLRSGSQVPEEPPRDFPLDKAEPYDKDRLRLSKTSGEAADMNKNITVAINETDIVDHPQVRDPGTTHEEDQHDIKGTIQACELPDPGSASSASDWLADSGHISKLADLCKLPSSLLNSTNRFLRVCSIPKDVWDSAGNNVTSGTVSKELLSKLNALNVTCVSPRSNSSDNGNDTITNGIPSASLWGLNNTIYIYIIPREWLSRKKPLGGKASEVEDLTKKPVPQESSTVASIAGSNSSTASPTTIGSSVASSGNITEVTRTPAPTTAAPVSAKNSSQTSVNATIPVSSNATNSNGSAANVTTVPASSDVNGTATNQSAAPVTTVVPPSKSKDILNNTQTSTSAPSKKAIDPVKSTDRPREETTKPAISKETKKPFDKAVDVVSTTTPVTAKQTSTKIGMTSTATLITSTEKPKGETALPQEHSDAENEVGHHAAPSPAPLSQSHSDHAQAESSGKTGFLQPTESAAILAGVFVAIAVLGYAGLLLWRRVLEKRYGNREMLVNEDDDFDTSDMRHFEL